MSQSREPSLLVAASVPAFADPATGRQDHEIRYRQELMRKRMMEEEMEGCTFSPAVRGTHHAPPLSEG